MRLPEGEARARFAAEPVARLGTADAQGRPHIVVVTFAVEGDMIYTAVDQKPKSSTELKRMRNIGENPRVTLLADHYSDDWDLLWWVRIDGWASVVDDDQGLQDPLDVLCERYDQYREKRPAGPVIVIQADRWKGWSST